MTKLSKSIRRESRATVFSKGQHRPINVTLGPLFIGFRLKGLEQTYTLPIDVLYDMALKAAIAERRRDLNASKRPKK